MKFLSLLASVLAPVVCGEVLGNTPEVTAVELESPPTVSGLPETLNFPQALLYDLTGGSATPTASVPNHGLALVAFYDSYCTSCQRVIQHMRYLRQEYWDYDIFYGAIDVSRQGSAGEVPLPQFVAMRDGKSIEQLYADDASVVMHEMDRVVSQYVAEINGGGGHSGGNGGGGYPDDGGNVEPITLLRQGP